MDKMNIETVFKKWWCRYCGCMYNLEIEDDEINTNMWCAKCNKLMYNIDEKTKTID